MTRPRTVEIGPEPMWLDDIQRDDHSAEHDHQWESRPIMFRMPAALARIQNEHVRVHRFVCFACGRTAALPDGEFRLFGGATA